MPASTGMPAGRFAARPIALFLGSGVLSAIGTAWLARVFLPYERLERFSPEEQFLAWEGVVWMIALVLGFFGVAAVLQVVGWRLRDGIVELVRHLTMPRSDDPVVVILAVLPWWMINYALCLMLIGGLARSYLAP